MKLQQEALDVDTLGNVSQQVARTSRLVESLPRDAEQREASAQVVGDRRRCARASAIGGAETPRTRVVTATFSPPTSS
jgi:hypothetical protein